MSSFTHAAWMLPRGLVYWKFHYFVLPSKPPQQKLFFWISVVKDDRMAGWCDTALQLNRKKLKDLGENMQQELEIISFENAEWFRWGTWNHWSSLCASHSGILVSSHNWEWKAVELAHSCILSPPTGWCLLLGHTNIQIEINLIKKVKKMSFHHRQLVTCASWFF